MTVRNFARALCEAGFFNDQVIIMHDGEEVYNNCMDFLRDSYKWFAGETVLRVNMERDRGGDYFTVLVI